MDEFDFLTNPVPMCLPENPPVEEWEVVTSEEKKSEKPILGKAIDFVRDLNNLSFKKRAQLAWTITKTIPTVFGELNHQAKEEAKENPGATFVAAIGTGFVMGGPPGAMLVGGLSLTPGCGGILEWDLDHDEDNDGFSYDQDGDCNDYDPKMNPSVPEIRYDQVDQNCNGMDDEDVDGDGQTVLEADCDDQDPTVFSGAIEFVDEVDNDCDGTVDEPNYLKEASSCYQGGKTGDGLGTDFTGGDLTGDGFSDLSLGAPGVDGQEAQSGKIYSFYGYEDSFQVQTDLSDTDASIVGINQKDWVGQEISTGDFDGDGRADLAVGVGQSDQAGVASGSVGLFFGDTLSMDLSLNSANLFWTGAENQGEAGISLSFVGDVNGDNFEDLLVGAPSTNDSQGAAYLLLGSNENWQEGDLQQASALTISGSTLQEKLGSSLSGGEDFNGDGYDDFVIGVPGYFYEGAVTGAAFLFLGAKDLPSSTPSAIFYGENNFDQVGTSVALIPDTNGDSLADLLVGAPGYNGPQTSSGKAYLVYGNQNIRTRSLADADLIFNGSQEYGEAGLQVNSLGDINGDSLGDWTIGSLHYGADDNAGATYLFLGGQTLSSVLTEADAHALFLGEAANEAYTARGIGNFNGRFYPNAKAYNDFIIGAPGANEGAGRACVFFGQETR